MPTKKEVRLDFDPDRTPKDEVKSLLDTHVEKGNIADNYEIEVTDGGTIYAHLDIDDSVEHPARFLFSAFTPYADTAWHPFD